MKAYEILQQARMTVKRTASVRVEPQREPGTEWKRPAPEPAPVRERLTDAEELRLEQHWQAKLDTRIAEERAVSQQVHVGVINQLRREHRAETAKLREMVMETHSCLKNLLMASNALERELRAEAERKSAEIVDLPQLPLRRRHG